MPERLLAETRALHQGVDALVKTLEREYPKREELRKARQSYTIAILLGLVLSAVICSLVTIGTISGCFLSKEAIDGHAPSVCSFLPGYTATQERAKRNNKRIFQLFTDVDTLKHNDVVQNERLDVLQKELAAKK